MTIWGMYIVGDDWKVGDKLINVGVDKSKFPNLDSDDIGKIAFVVKQDICVGYTCYNRTNGVEARVPGQGIMCGNQENLEGWGWVKLEPVSSHV
jgi:hypothetical protein